MKKEWLCAVSNMTYGIYVLTTAYEKKINGMIASWVSKVSYEPLLIMVAVHPNRYTHKLIEKSRCFALHILARDQKDLLARFKGPDPISKFSGVQWDRGYKEVPILKDCIAFMECEVKESYAPGNHTLFIGEIINAKVLNEKPMLTTMDYDGVYTGRS